MGTTLQEQALMAKQLVTHYRALVVQETFPKVVTRKMRALQAYGFPDRYHGFDLRPAFDGQLEVSQCLSQYTQEHSLDLLGLPKLRLHDNFEMWPEDMCHFTTPMELLINASKSAIRRTKKARST